MKKFLKRLLGALVLLFVTILVTPFFIVFLAAIIGACVIGIALSPIIVYFLIASYGKEMIDKQIGRDAYELVKMYTDEYRTKNGG